MNNMERINSEDAELMRLFESLISVANKKPNLAIL